MAKFKVAVLLASFNGASWLPIQLETVLKQTDIEVFIYISDDFSDDGTFEFIESLCIQYKSIKLLPKTLKFGSAGKNFYRLIRDVDFNGFDYIAFADQDDIWEYDKLIKHIHLIENHGADGVSSNVTAFWSDGRRKLINKSQPQRDFDYLFESAGPGCTFLITPWLANKVKSLLNDPYYFASEIVLHDWLTYAVCRASGRTWWIDNTSSMSYRQHQFNVLGANSGLKPSLARLLKLKNGWYRNEVLKISHLCTKISGNLELQTIVKLLAQKSIFSQFKLLYFVPKFRRKLIDRYILAFSIVFFLF